MKFRGVVTGSAVLALASCVSMLAGQVGIGTRGGLGVGGVGGAGVGARAATPAIDTTLPRTDVGVRARAQDDVAARVETMRRTSPEVTFAGNSALAVRSQALLPAGVSAEDAARGFKNSGDFLAAAHASQNLNIPFEEMKTRMTGSHKTDLRGAIHEFRANADAKAEAKKADAQARADLEAEAKQQRR